MWIDGLEVSQAIYLAVVQGFTEFLPVSSSGHLVLAPLVMGRQVQNVSFDTAVHFGSLIAVIWYFRRDLFTISLDWKRSLSAAQPVGESPLFWAVLWGTVPVGLFGLVLHFIYDDRIHSAVSMSVVVLVTGLLLTGFYLLRRESRKAGWLALASLTLALLIALAFWLGKGLRSAVVIATTTVFFGVLLWLADVRGARRRGLEAIGWRDILIIGVAQACALVPGTSRSGITITAALLLGFRREAAARFSFLLSIPTIILATAAQTNTLLHKSSGVVQWDILGVGILVSALTAYLCIYLFLRLIERIGMFPFVIYRFLLGGALFYFLYYGLIDGYVA